MVVGQGIRQSGGGSSLHRELLGPASKIHRESIDIRPGTKGSPGKPTCWRAPGVALPPCLNPSFSLEFLSHRAVETTSGLWVAFLSTYQSCRMSGSVAVKKMPSPLRSGVYRDKRVASTLIDAAGSKTTPSTTVVRLCLRGRCWLSPHAEELELRRALRSHARKGELFFQSGVARGDCCFYCSLRMEKRF